jgi:hypothetical protein
MLKSERPDLDNDALAKFVARRVIRTSSVQGMALALPGAVPGLGTAVQVTAQLGTVAADIALMLRNQAYLVFSLGCIYGLRGRELLIQDVLISIGLWTKALALTKSGAIRIGTKVVEANFKKHFSAEVLKNINRKLSTTVLTKYGTKRGGIALGKLIPFGVGVVVGGSFNYLAMRSFAASTTDYFALHHRQ